MNLASAFRRSAGGRVDAGDVGRKATAGFSSRWAIALVPGKRKRPLQAGGSSTQMQPAGQRAKRRHTQPATSQFSSTQWLRRRVTGFGWNPALGATVRPGAYSRVEDCCRSRGVAIPGRRDERMPQRFIFTRLTDLVCEGLVGCYWADAARLIREQRTGGGVGDVVGHFRARLSGMESPGELPNRL